MRSAAPHEEDSASIDMGCARSSARAALHRETRRAVHRRDVRRPARHPILVAMESIHLIAKGIRGQGFVNDRKMASERPECSDSCETDGYSCNVCGATLHKGSVGDTHYPRVLVTSMALGASLFFFVFYVTLYLRESSSFVFAKNLTRFGLNYLEDEGRIGLNSGMENSSKRKGPRGRSPSRKLTRKTCQDYMHGKCTKPSCDFWHPPECQYYKKSVGMQVRR